MDRNIPKEGNRRRKSILNSTRRNEPRKKGLNLVPRSGDGEKNPPPIRTRIVKRWWDTFEYKGTPVGEGEG